MVDPSGKVVKIFNNKFELKRNLNRTELDRFLATPLHRSEVFASEFTEQIIEHVLCKAFRGLNGAKTAPWCDTLLPGQQLFHFKSHCVLAISWNGDTEEAEGTAIINRFACGDRLLMMEEVLLTLGFPVVMPLES
jgi:hypothetical protein